MGWIAGLRCPRARASTRHGLNLAMAIDCGRAAGDDELAEAAAAARRLFLPTSALPAPMSRRRTPSPHHPERGRAHGARAANEYAEWLEAYLPQLFRAHFDAAHADLPGRWNGEGYLDSHRGPAHLPRACRARRRGGASGRTRPGPPPPAAALARRGRAGRSSPATWPTTGLAASSAPPSWGRSEAKAPLWLAR